MVDVSIIISSYKRHSLFKRTLRSIVNNPPSLPWELVIVDETSSESDLLLQELSQYSTLRYKFISFNSDLFTEKTTLKKFFNNPSVTNNIGWKNSSGKYLFLQGNEVITMPNTYDMMIKDWQDSNAPYGIVFSETYDIPNSIIDRIGEYGENFKGPLLSFCHCWPLQKVEEYESLVTNYLSLTNKATWNLINGYEEIFTQGIACEDSMFVYRVRNCPNSQVIFSKARTYHQFHGGKTKYYTPLESIISGKKWDEGLSINRKYYYEQIKIKSYKNPQTWEPGEYGITNIIKHGY